MDNKPPMKLYQLSLLEQKDELEEKLEKAYRTVVHLLSNLSDVDSLDALQKYNLRGVSFHDEIQYGLFYGIIIDSLLARKYYSFMVFASQDGMMKMVTMSNQLLFEKWNRLSDHSKQQFLWLARELVTNGVSKADTVIHNLLRQIAGGDLSVRNIWLTESTLDLLSSNRQWLDKNPNFIPFVLFTFLRVVMDHNSTHLSSLRQKETEFCISLIREKWTECQTIGRDLVRLLQGVARIPEFRELWKDILNNPSSLHPHFTGIKQLMQTKTSRSLFISRLTPDMETKLSFLSTQVKFGSQKRYQDWFQRQYLSTPESQSLRCDMIRYICSVIHPPNEVLCSDIIPRWAVIGWLLTTCTSNVAASNAKLALFFDWLFFDPEKDNIMNIEPCILVMFNSMRPHPAISVTLLDFMCRISSHFHPSLAFQVRTGICNSLSSILEKRVLQSLSPLFNNSKLDKDLLNLIRSTFPEFCTENNTNSSATNTTTNNSNNNNSNNNISNTATSTSLTINYNNNTNSYSQNNKTFSNDNEPPPDQTTTTNSLSKNIIFVHTTDNISITSSTAASTNFPFTTSSTPHSTLNNISSYSINNLDISNKLTYENKESNTTNITITPTEQQSKINSNHVNNNSFNIDVSNFRDDEDSNHSNCDNRSTLSSSLDLQMALNNLDEKFKQLLTAMSAENDKGLQCEQMEKVLQRMMRDGSLEEDEVENLSRALHLILLPHFKEPLLPREVDEETLEESLGLPLFVIFRNIQQCGEEDPGRVGMLSLLEEMYSQQKKIGYYLLYFLKASSKVKHEVRMACYRDFCKNMERDLEFYLISDLKNCLEDDVNLFSFLVPDIYEQFPSVAMGNVELLYLVVSSIDGVQLQGLICEVLQGHLVMFNKDSFLSVLNASLNWETIEQYFLWKLIFAHQCPPSFLVPILPKLDFNIHSEAISNIMILLKQDGPSPEILKCLLSRESKRTDLLTVSMLRFWAQEYGERLADLLNTQLTRCCGNNTKKKNRGQSHHSSKVKEKDQPSVEMILSHLDHMRLTCKDISFLSNESIQQGLQTVQTSCSDSLKVKYGDLLALVEDLEESKSTRVLRQVPSRRASQAANKSSAKQTKRAGNPESESSSDTSEEEDPIQTSKNKKLKRTAINDD